MDSTRIALYVVGGLLELSGIVLVAAPDASSAAADAREWLSGQWARIASRIARLLRRLLGRPTIVYAKVGGGEIGVASSMSAYVTRRIDSTVPLEQQVAELIEHDVEAQKRLGALEGRVTEETKSRQAAIEQAQRQTEERMRAEMRALLDTHKRLRQIGLGLLIAGAICMNAGNFM